MMLLIWIILMCVGLDPISSFVVSLIATAILGAMEEEPRVVNNIFIGGNDDDENS